MAYTVSIEYCISKRMIFLSETKNEVTVDIGHVLVPDDMDVKEEATILYEMADEDDDYTEWDIELVELFDLDEEVK